MDSNVEARYRDPKSEPADKPNKGTEVDVVPTPPADAPPKPERAPRNSARDGSPCVSRSNSEATAEARARLWEWVREGAAAVEPGRRFRREEWLGDRERWLSCDADRSRFFFPEERGAVPLTGPLVASGRPGDEPVVPIARGRSGSVTTTGAAAAGSTIRPRSEIPRSIPTNGVFVAKVGTAVGGARNIS
mmetsp:Transcript_20861/g.42027  ORF Transcript_20861/g.42027 Transcript_20861/m.42027 type:complete len:190 (-) Transcript_20861:123-692(-)